MRLLMVGLSHKTAPLELREALALEGERLGRAYDALRGSEGLREVLLLSTCNRVEVYAAVEDAAGAEAFLRRFLENLRPDKAAQVRRSLQALGEEHALWHLLKVAASLDSMVLGEAQILGQVKQAYAAAVERKAVGPFFHGLCQRVFAAAKEVRSKTELGRHPASVPSVAVQLAERLFGDLSARRALVVGAGEVAELCAEHLKSSGVKRMIVCNRSAARARELARRLEAEARPLEELEALLGASDLVVFSASVQVPLWTRAAAERVLAARRGAPQLLLDLGVPRNVEPAVKELEPAYLYNVDDLQALAEEHRERRLEASRQAEEILKRHLLAIKEWLAAAKMGPTIRALAERLEALRRAEWERLLPRLGHLDPKDVQKIEYLSRALIQKILDLAIRRLKSSSASGKTALHLESLAELFDLKIGP